MLYFTRWKALGIIITALVVWGALPFLVITLYAGLMQVPRELLEAARSDGATAWQVFWQVTAPILRPIFVILLILWLLGMVTSNTMGGFIHILLVVAIVVVLIRVIQGRNPI